jgi:uncharacterized protein (UPF0332 family)
MFDAARAALAVADDEGMIAKTQSGLISAFSLRFVKTAEIPVELGKALNAVSELRQAGDYTGLDDAEGQSGLGRDPGRSLRRRHRATREERAA